MEGKEGGKGRMIPWWVGLICWVVGEIMGFMTIIICMGSGNAEEKEKAADAGTSTAAYMGRKDYFL